MPLRQIQEGDTITSHINTAIEDLTEEIKDGTAKGWPATLLHRMRLELLGLKRAQYICTAVNTMNNKEG